MLLAAVFADWCVVVLLASFFSLLLLLIVRLTASFFLVVFDERHHLFHRISGAFNKRLHLFGVFFGERRDEFFRCFGLLLDHVGFEVLRGKTMPCLGVRSGPS